MRFAMPDPLPVYNDDKAVRRKIASKEKAVRQAFAEHNARLRPLLPPALQELQDTDLSDGLWQSLWINHPAKTLHVCFVCGNAQSGYFDLHLNYSDVAMSPTETNLLCLLANEPSSEIRSDEIDLDESKSGAPLRFVHRIQWSTAIDIERRMLGATNPPQPLWAFTYLRPEIEIVFRDLTLQKIPCIARNVVRPRDFISVEPVFEHFQEEHSIKEQFDAVYDQQDSRPDPLFVELQARSLSQEDEW